MGFTKFSVKDLDKEEQLSAEEEAKYTKYFEKFDKASGPPSGRLAGLWLLTAKRHIHRTRVATST